MTSRISDIRDYEAVQEVVAEARPEIVIHMAAQSLVRTSYRNPVETYATNVMGTVHLLEAVRQVGPVRVVVNVTTDKCYENREWVWGYREQDPMGGHDPYSSSKGCAELVTAAYRRSFYEEAGIALASVRAGNVIGGGDWSDDRLLPDILRQFASGEPVQIRSPDAVRPWQFVLEPLSGYLQLAQRLWEDADASGAWNFGPEEGDAKPVRWIVEQVAARWGGGASWSTTEEPQPHEAMQLRLDIAKARMQLGWRPVCPLDTALDWTVAWHRAWLEGADVQAVCRDQITRYAALRSHP